MEYLKINGADFSQYVNELKIEKRENYNSQTNAAGNTVIDHINSKYVITVGFIPMGADAMKALLKEIGYFSISVFFLDPLTNTIKMIRCIVPEHGIDYYTIQNNKVMYNTFTIEFVEL